jgi:hypothetical protein
MKFSEDPHPGGPVEWADNPLSNFLAWGAKTFVPSWCTSGPDHWTSRLTQYFFSDCPCCLFGRGIVLGGAVFGVIGLLVGLAVS